jgi:hypothetical protein
LCTKPSIARHGNLERCCHSFSIARYFDVLNYLLRCCLEGLTPIHPKQINAATNTMTHT